MRPKLANLQGNAVTLQKLNYDDILKARAELKLLKEELEALEQDDQELKDEIKDQLYQK